MYLGLMTGLQMETKWSEAALIPGMRDMEEQQIKQGPVLSGWANAFEKIP